MADPLSIETWRGIFTRHGQKLGWGLAAVFGVPLVIGFGLNQYSGRGSGASNATPENTVLMTVNGTPVTQLEYLESSQMARGAEAGTAFARAQGEIINRLVTFALLRQEAQKRNVRASDADIDSEIAKEREAAGKGEGKTLSDSDWEDRLQQMRGMSAADYREYVANQLVGLALLNSMKAAEKVSDEDIRHQNDEVKLTDVLIPTISANTMFPDKDKKQLPDAQAKQKAEDLLAKVRAGADIAAIARANSSDFNAKQGGLIDWRPEYNIRQGMPAATGALGYGKDVDAAIHKTATEQYTDVVKSGGFSPGYFFAKILDRRNKPPKDFDSKKAADQLKDDRAKQKLNDLIKADLKTAKVEFKDPDKKAYYDYFKFAQMQEQQMYAQFGQPSDDTPPTAADVAKQQTAVDADFEGVLKRHPDDATAALMVAEALKRNPMGAPPVPGQPAAAPALASAGRNDRLIGLYETALKSTENRDTRMSLADLYRDKKQYDKADTNYAMITKLMSYDPPQDQNSMQTALGVHQQLQARFLSINKPDEAAKEQAAITQLQGQIAEEKRKAAAQAPTGGAGMPGGPGASLSLPGNTGAAAPSVKVAPSTSGAVSVPAPKSTKTP